MYFTSLGNPYLADNNPDLITSATMGASGGGGGGNRYSAAAARAYGTLGRAPLNNQPLTTPGGGEGGPQAPPPYGQPDFAAAAKGGALSAAQFLQQQQQQEEVSKQMRLAQPCETDSPQSSNSAVELDVLYLIYAY